MLFWPFFLKMIIFIFVMVLIGQAIFFAITKKF